jgi:hypothetical protein
MPPIDIAAIFRAAAQQSLLSENTRKAYSYARMRIRKEKQDQEGQGRTIGVAAGECPETCPVAAVKAWLAIRGAITGPLFVTFSRQLKPTESRLDARHVARAVQETALSLGLDSSQYGGHSLRAGFVTAAVLGGASEFAIMEQTGHKSTVMVRRYYRNADPFARNASAMLGL